MLRALGFFGGAETAPPPPSSPEQANKSVRVSGRLSLAEKAIIKIDVAMAISGIAGH